MPKSYRAMISVPIAAEDDDQAEHVAYEFARSLWWPGSNTIAGHLELLTETQDFSLEPKRVVVEDHWFRRQLGRTGKFLTELYERDIGNTLFTNSEQARISAQLKQIKR